MPAFLIAECLFCGRIFTCNPDTVPSLRVRRNPTTGELSVDPTAPREPICAGCMAQANAERIRRGMEPHAIHPTAYEPSNDYFRLP